MGSTDIAAKNISLSASSGVLSPRALSTAASAHLDVIRAVASWAVMWGHLRTLFFVEFQQLQAPNLFYKTIYFLTGFGHQAVMVFFVLSGFLISSTIFKSYAAGKWSWREYAIHRAARLYAVLVPGLLLGLLWDRMGVAFFANTGIYTHALTDFGSGIPANNLSVGTFLGNLAFLQTIVCSSFGSNGPLWSLANEFWYYVLFPLGLAGGIAWARKSYLAAAPLTFLAVAVAAIVGREMLVGFLIWLAGCAVVGAYSWWRVQKKILLIPYLLMALLVLGGCLVAARFSIAGWLGGDPAVGVAFALFLFAILHLEYGGNSPEYSRAAHLFAGFSYSLYVLHFPLLLFVKCWLVPGERWQPDAKHLFVGLVLGLGMMAFAWAVSLVTENRTSQLRGMLRRLTGVSGQPR